MIREQIEFARDHLNDALRREVLLRGSVMHGALDTMEKLLFVYEAAKDVYEWSEPQSELQQVEMLVLYDAMKALQAIQEPDDGN